MATATRPKPATKNLLTDLQERETALDQARADAKAASRELHEARTLIEGLHAERQRLVHREPELVNYDGTPVAEDNAVAMVDRKLGSVPDIEVLRQRADHAAAVANRREQGLNDWMSQRRDALADALLPEAERLHAEAEAQRVAAAGAAGDYRAFVQDRWERLTGKRREPALDVAADIARHLNEIGFREITR
jgi:hypothetical protein